MKTGRNEACPCGSGKKFKQCCATKKTRREWMTIAIWIGLAALIGSGIYAAFRDGSPEPPPGKVWSEEHGHYHDVPG